MQSDDPDGEAVIRWYRGSWGPKRQDERGEAEPISKGAKEESERDRMGGSGGSGVVRRI